MHDFATLLVHSLAKLGIDATNDKGQAEAGKLLGVGRTTLKTWRNGERTPTERGGGAYIEHVAKALKISPKTLRAAMALTRSVDLPAARHVAIGKLVDYATTTDALEFFGLFATKTEDLELLERERDRIVVRLERLRLS